MNQSVAVNQFPQTVWRDGEKLLWNPIHKRALKNRPEERVRLRIIEFLIAGGWSKHRISTEEALSSKKEKTPLRTDIICYTQQFNPFLLVECKAELIKITEQTATQIARYNQNIGAPYLLMTNSMQDYWYSIEKKNDLHRIGEIPDALPALQEPEPRALAYWKKRGFAGEDAPPPLRSWIEEALNQNFVKGNTTTVRFLSFKQRPSDADLNNYYAIYQHKNHRLAITFTATSFGGSRLIAIINKNGKNTGVMEINLDLLFDERAPNTSLYDAGGIENFDLRSRATWNSQPLPFNDLLPHLNRIISAAAN